MTEENLKKGENIENKNSLRKKREGSPADRKIQEASPGDRIIIAQSYGGNQQIHNDYFT